MVGAFEIVVGTIALAKVLSQTVDQVLKLYKAPAEVVALQKQLEALSATLQTVSGATATTNLLDSSSVLTSAVAKTRLAVEALDLLIKERLLGPEGTRSKARRTLYLWNKRQIIRLQEDLRVAREELLQTISVESLLCAHRIENNLAVNNSHACSAVHATSWSEMKVVSRARERSVHFGSTHTLETLVPSDPGDESQDQLRCLQLERSTISSFLQAGPASSFEQLPSMRPEIYTNADEVPQLFAYFCRQISANDYTQVAQFSIFYTLAASQWVRLVLTLTTSIDSPYWNVSRYQSDVTYSKGRIKLIKPIAAALYRGLLAHQSDGDGAVVGQDRHLSMYLGKSNNEPDMLSDPLPRLRAISPADDNITYLHAITARVRHWQCPRYSARELIRRPESSPNPDNRFIAFIKSFWAREVLFGPDKPRNENLFNELQILNVVGRPGDNASINPLLGLVFDDDTGLITGFLTAIPAKGTLLMLMHDQEREGRPVTWTRRAKWCRQIIEGVSVIHAADKVIGCLGDRPEAKVSIDADDNAVLWGRFLLTFNAHHMYPGGVPPELANGVKCAHTSGSPVVVTPEADVYQLGLLLWGIATRRPMTGRPDFCAVAGCPHAEDAFCDAAHTDPVQLPLRGLGIPIWLQRVINACREGIQHRPPAHQLQQLMSSDNDHSDFGVVTEDSEPDTPSQTVHFEEAQDRRTTSSTISDTEQQRPGSTPRTLPPCSSPSYQQMTRLEQVLSVTKCTTTCTICWKPVTGVWYKCNVCDTGDFDLCADCFNKGRHCYDPREHYLARHSDEAVGGKADLFYSAVRQFKGELKDAEDDRDEQTSSSRCEGEKWIRCAGGMRELMVLR